jgi:hypothetical protein
MAHAKRLRTAVPLWLRKQVRSRSTPGYERDAPHLGPFRLEDISTKDRLHFKKGRIEHRVVNAFGYHVWAGSKELCEAKVEELNIAHATWIMAK